jgi:hypothetical protein
MARSAILKGRNFIVSLRGTVFVPKQSPIRRVGIASPSARNDSKFLSRSEATKQSPASDGGDCFAPYGRSQ